jgi:exosortase D (VPLPA-CTERM-specific)
MASQSIDQGADGGTVWRLPWGMLAVVVGAALTSVLPFWSGLTQMWQFWIDFPEYSHCLLIPPVAAFLLWQQKDRLEQVRFSGSWWGVALVIAGGALLVAGQLGTVYTLVQYAYLITLDGLVLSLLGVAAFRLVAVPLLILWLMVPLPTFFLYNLSAKLQLLSSQIGVFVIRLFDISVFLEGNVIDLGGYKLQVAEACSGLRYLFPLMTLGFLMAYFYKGATWKRIVLFLSSMPITVLMNSIRVGVIGVTVDRWGIAMAEGFLHEFQGWMVFMVSAALMLGEVVLLNAIGHENGSWRQLFGIELPAPTPGGARVRRREVPKSFIAAVTLLAFLVVAAWATPRPAEIVPARTAFVQFPLELAGWQGHRESLDGIYTDQLQLDDYLLADFSDGVGAPVNFYVSWYNSQRKGEAVHSPRACLPGGGWQIREFDQRTLDGVTPGGRPLRVNRAVVELGNQRELVYYWFQQRGRIIDNEFAVKGYLFLDALTRHRTDGAMVRLITAYRETDGDDRADARLTGFAKQVVPLLPQYVPD